MLSDAAKRQLAIAAHEAVLRGEVDKGVIGILPNGERWPTYFSSDTGTQHFAGAPSATHVPNLGAAEALVGDELPELLFLEIETDGYSGTAGIILKVNAYRREWISEDARMVETDSWHVFYCLVRDGDRFTTTRFMEY